MRIGLFSLLFLVSAVYGLLDFQSFNLIDDPNGSYNPSNYSLAIDEHGILTIDYETINSLPPVLKVARPFDREVGIQVVESNKTISFGKQRMNFKIATYYNSKFSIESSNEVIVSFILELPRSLSQTQKYGLDIVRKGQNASYRIIAPSEHSARPWIFFGDPPPYEFKTSRYRQEKATLDGNLELRDDCSSGQRSSKLYKRELKLRVKSTLDSTLRSKFILWECKSYTNVANYNKHFTTLIGFWSSECISIPEPPWYIDSGYDQNCVGRLVGERYNGYRSVVIYRSGDPALTYDKPISTGLIIFCVFMCICCCVVVIACVALCRGKRQSQMPPTMYQMAAQSQCNQALVGQTSNMNAEYNAPSLQIHQQPGYGLSPDQMHMHNKH